MVTYNQYQKDIECCYFKMTNRHFDYLHSEIDRSFVIRYCHFLIGSLLNSVLSRILNIISFRRFK